MKGSKEVAGRETLVVPDCNLKTATVLQLIQRHVRKYELLIPRWIQTVAYDGRLAVIFAYSIYRQYTTVKQ